MSQVETLPANADAYAGGPRADETTPMLHFKPANELHSACDIRRALLAHAGEITLRVDALPQPSREDIDDAVRLLVKSYVHAHTDSAINMVAVLPEIEGRCAAPALVAVLALAARLQDDEDATVDLSEVRGVAEATWYTLLCALLATMGIEAGR